MADLLRENQRWGVVVIATADPVSQILELLPGHRKTGDSYSFKCPAHEDRTASGSLSRGRDNRALIKCHAGCTTESICESLGLKTSDLFVKSNGNGVHAPHKNGSAKKIIATYNYTDVETGETISQKVRFQPKEFQQRRPDGNGGWSYDLREVRRQLYRLAELYEADPAEIVFFVEGEKAVEVLRGMELIATCTPDGAAAKWREHYTEMLRGRRVAVLADNDDAGREHAKKVAIAIESVVAELRIVELPGLPPKGDVVDFLESGKTAADLMAVIEAAPLYRPGATTGFQTVRDLMRAYPELRPAVIRGLLRRGETMNVISSPKMGKSWFVLCLVISVTMGLKWLNTFETVQGDVLIIDNELHGETMASRIPRVAGAMGLTVDQFCDHVFVDNIRGRLRSIFEMEDYFAAIKPGQFKVIVLDAIYRFLPQDSEENSQAIWTNLYNFLDRHADRLGCCFVLIHHASKGNQSAKEITGVGSGGGSQSRATDTHLIMRPHEEDGVVVLDAAVRSWAPIDPMCLRWDFPLFHLAAELDPSQLRQENRRKRKEEKQVGDVEPKVEWTTASFVAAFISEESRTESTIMVESQAKGLSDRKAKRFLDVAVDSNLAYRWTYADRKKPHRFATIPQTLFETEKGVQK